MSVNISARNAKSCILHLRIISEICKQYNFSYECTFLDTLYSALSCNYVCLDIIKFSSIKDIVVDNLSFVLADEQNVK